MFSKRSVLAFASAVALAASAVSISAYEFNPLVMELTPTGPGSSSNGVIKNTHAEPIAIELQVFKRVQNPDGTEELTPETQDFIVTPPQMVIQPGESQAFRVQWVGDQNPSQELAYRLVSDQLPIKFRQESRNDFTADVGMKYRYEGALYVQPRGTRPNAHLDSARVVGDDSDGGRWLELTIASTGTRRAILDRPRLTLTAGGSTIDLEGEEVGELSGLNILPGSSRTIRIPVPNGLPAGDVSGKLTTSYVVLR